MSPHDVLGEDVIGTGLLPWQPNTTYAAGSSVIQAGVIYTTVISSGTFTSASTWAGDSANWTTLVVAPLKPSGGDDTAAINAAAAAGRDLAAGTFLISGAVACPYGQGQALTVIKATAAAACVQSGPALPAAPSNALQQRAGNFKFDGNAVATGGGTKIAVLINTVNWRYDPIQVTNLPANVDAFVYAGQNDQIDKLEADATGTGFCLAFDNGAGGGLIRNLRTGGGNQIEFRETVGTNGYGIPSHNVIDTWIGDQPVTGTYAIRHRAGHLNVIRDSEWVHRTAAAAIKFEANTGGYTGTNYANGMLVLEGKNKFEGAGEGVLGGEGQSFAWADFSNDGATSAGAMADVVALWCSGVLNVAGVDREFKWGSTTPVVGGSCQLYRQPTSTTRPLWVASGSGALSDADGLWRLQSQQAWGLGGLPDATLGSKMQARKAIVGVHDAYRELPTEWGLGLVLGSASAAGTYLASSGVVGSAGSAKSAFYLDPADFPTINGVAKLLRVRGIVVTNAVPPATNYTFVLYPVATWGGASTATPTVATVGAAVASTATITTPAAGGPQVAVSSDTTFPSAGYYVLAVVLSGAQATNAVVTVRAALHMRWG